MECFDYDASAGYTLQELGVMHDDWLNRIWKQYQFSNIELTSNIDDDCHVQEKSKYRAATNCKKGYISVEHESDRILCRVPNNAKLKDIKDILRKKIRIGKRWRYFFLTWCKELNTKVKHEVVNDSEIVPQYRNSYFIYIEK